MQPHKISPPLVKCDVYNVLPTQKNHILLKLFYKTQIHTEQYVL